MGGGHHYHLFTGWLQRRRRRHFGGVSPQLFAEIDVVGQDDRPVVVAFGEDLPTPLVAGEIVKLKIAAAAAAQGGGAEVAALRGGPWGLIAV